MGLDEEKRRQALEKIRQFKLKLPEGFIAPQCEP
jgi:hypothetical protein